MRLFTLCGLHIWGASMQAIAGMPSMLHRNESLCVYHIIRRLCFSSITAVCVPCLTPYSMEKLNHIALGSAGILAKLIEISGWRKLYLASTGRLMITCETTTVHTLFVDWSHVHMACKTLHVPEWCCSSGKPLQWALWQVSIQSQARQSGFVLWASVWAGRTHPELHFWGTV